LTALSEAHQLWVGIERPCNDYNYGEDVFIYVTKPRHSYEMVSGFCMARRIPVPDNEVLTVFVRFHPNWEDIGDEEPRGTVIGWRFYRTEKDDIMTPSGALERYHKRLW